MKELFYLLILIFVFLSIQPIRYKIRERMMKKLAKEFNLSFNSNPPKFFDFYFKFLIFKPDWDINHIKGVLNNHSICVYDNLFSGPKTLLMAFNYGKNHTVVEIDGQKMTGKEDQYKSFKLQDQYLTSVLYLRKLFESLKQF